MFSKKEIAYIIISAIIIGFAFSFIRDIKNIHWAILSVLLAGLINVFAKKISAYYFDSEVEINIWEMQRFGFKPDNYLRRPIPMGGIMPLLLSIATYGYLTWMASLVFEVKAKVYRASKRYGLYTYSEMTEYHIGLIASSGILMNLLFSIVGYLIGFNEFAEINIYYAFFNMIPFSDLDGNKVFFGSFILWSFLASLTLVGLGYIFLVV